MNLEEPSFFNTIVFGFPAAFDRGHGSHGRAAQKI
jgi:hypothetical protein